MITYICQGDIRENIKWPNSKKSLIMKILGGNKTQNVYSSLSPFMNLFILASDNVVTRNICFD
jgi:hypothetical protein